jgi:hypothetical protein
VARAAPQTAVVLTVRNISSLSDDDVGRIRRALRAELRNRKIRLTTNKRAAAEVQVTLSENVEGLTWVAEIQVGTGREVALITVARPPPAALHTAAEPLTVRKIRLFEQAEPMLDVVPLASSPSDALAPGTPPAPPARILVLGLGAVSLYEKAAADKTPPSGAESLTWQRKASMPFIQVRAGARDGRGRLVVRTDNQFDVYLPGGKCSGSLEPPAVECHESEDPWPLGPAGPPDALGPAAYFTPDRNFFDGRIRLEDGHEIKVPPFFAAAVPRGDVAPRPIGAGAGLKPGATSAATSAATSGAAGTLWLVTGLDSRAQLLNAEGVSLANIGGLGSAIVGLQSGCRSGWQILATQAGDFNDPDAVQAYEVVNHKAVEASVPLEFAGPLTELWPLANGSEAVAISHNLKTAEYEAFRVSISCGQ